MEVKLLEHEKWQPERVMAFSGIDGRTSYGEGLVLHAADEPGWDIKLPAAARIRFPSDTPKNFWSCGDAFRWENDNGSITCGAMVDAHHVLLQGYTAIECHSEELQILSANDMTLIGTVGHFVSAWIQVPVQKILNQRTNWLDRMEVPEKVTAHGGRDALARALSQMKGQVCSGEGRFEHRWSTPSRWPNRELAQWDSAFLIRGFRHVDLPLARELIQVVLEQQEEDGFLPNLVNPESASKSIHPPILAAAVWDLHQTKADTAWLGQIYPLLCSYLEWDTRNRDRDGNGLPEWKVKPEDEHPGQESGMDNSPRFDKTFSLDAVDFCAYLSRDYECLNMIARELGKVDDQAMWRGRHFQLNAVMRQRLWNTDTEFFHDYDLDEDALSPVLAVSGFLPLICGGASKEQAQKLVEHLNNPDTFGTPVPIPSIAACEPAFGGNWWRGPMWVNMNWLVAEGLDRYGFRKEASKLRNHTAGEIVRQVQEYGSFFACYDTMGQKAPVDVMSGEKGQPHEGCEFGWSAGLLVDWLFRGVRPVRADLIETA